MRSLMGEPATRDLILKTWANTGGWHSANHLAMWFGRPAAEVRAELEAMEREGLAERWHEAPRMRWRWGPPHTTI